MKKNILLLLLLCMAVVMQATDLTGVKIYVNPGHGGHNPNDRSVWTIPVPETWENPNGYWESNSNLVKGLALRDMLQAAGATVIMSRVTNTSGIRDLGYYPNATEEEKQALINGDDRSLSAIAEEANANNVDHFLSIHSNAHNTMTNYLLVLYRGKQGSPTTPPSDQMAASFGNIQIQNPLTVWTSPNPMLRGDISFYPPDWNGLGVLRPLTVPGFLSEGSFHDYPPETHRLCNNDYCKLEAIRLFEHFYTWFEKEAPTTGTISGWVKSKNELVDVLDKPQFTYRPNSDDQWLPLNGATVKLLSSTGDVLKTYTTDDWYNGIFAFYDLAPGNYKVSVEKPNYKKETQEVTVEAAKIAGLKVRLKNIRLDLPDYPEPIQDAGLVSLENYEFEAVGTPQTPDWMTGAVIRRAVDRNGKIYILTETPKLLVVNASTLALEKEMKLTGIDGISDIACAADHDLLAITKATNGCKVYHWIDEDADPTLLFESNQHGAFANATVGSAMAVTGSHWNCTVYTTVINTEGDGSSSAIALMGMKYNANTPAEITTKYLQAEDALTAAAWGTNIGLTVMPGGNLYVDSESILPIEYIFDWNKADGAGLEKKSFTEKNGFTPDVSSCGGTFFRYAKQNYLAMPIAEAGSTKVGVSIFNVTDGIDKALKISDKYPAEGLGTTPATYMTAFGLVDGRHINLSLLAQQQGFGRYKTSSKPILNIYASELSISEEKNFNFKLNEEAINVFISIYKDGELLESYSAGALPKGAHTIANPFGNKDFDGWGITASALPVVFPIKISDDSPLFQFYTPCGVAIDNNPESPFFGRVYVTESIGGLISEGSPANPRTTKAGVYILDALFKDITGQGSESYAGNVEWGTNDSKKYQYKLARPAVAADGKVYIPNSTLDGSGVYIMDPVNPAADFKPVFTGERDSLGVRKINNEVIHSPIMSCYVRGKGANTQLYTYDRNTDPRVHVNIHQYDIGYGSTLPWTEAPSAIPFKDQTPLMQNGNGCIAPDGRGGWWLSQYRFSSSAEVPALIHITDGAVNYNCGTNISGSHRGAMTVNRDGSVLAIGREKGEVALYDIVFNAENVPTVTEKLVIKWGTGNTMGLAFDVAGNLYIVSNSNERLMVYSLPNLDNSYTSRVSAQQSSSGLNTASAGDRVRIYPNPVSNTIHIDTQDIKIEGYKLYNAAGALISAGEISRGGIPASQLQQGIYCIRLHTNQGIINKRIIKQ